jgi:hypothetical protein
MRLSGQVAPQAPAKLLQLLERIGQAFDLFNRVVVAQKKGSIPFKRCLQIGRDPDTLIGAALCACVVKY